MNKEAFVLAETILRLFNENKIKAIENLILKLKREKKQFLFKEIINYLEEKKDKDFLKGKLILAFEDENLAQIKDLLEKKLKQKLKIEKIKVDKSLILGGVFLTQNIQFDFSFKNLIKKLFQ